MEVDNEVKGAGNYYDFGYRVYDPRLGKFFSQDPEAQNYPSQSPYVYAANNPIAYLEIEGAWPCWKCWAKKALTVVSTVLDFVPVVGQVKAAAEAIIGYSMDGTKLSHLDRGLAIAGLVPGGRLLAKVGKAIVQGAKKVVKVVKKSKIAKKIHKVVKKAHFRIKVKAKSPPKKTGTAGGDRAGKDFTRKGKKDVIDENKERYGGETICEECKVKTVPAQKSQKGVTPPQNETQVDHILPKSHGGDGSLSNGQVLCRGCNRSKSDKISSETVFRNEAGDILNGPQIIYDSDGIMKDIHIYKDGKYLGHGKFDEGGNIVLRDTVKDPLPDK